MGTPPAQRIEVAPPPAQRGQPGGPSTQREFGIAPPFKGNQGKPSADRPAPQLKLSVPSQPRGGTPGAPHGQKEEK